MEAADVAQGVARDGAVRLIRPPLHEREDTVGQRLLAEEGSHAIGVQWPLAHLLARTKPPRLRLGDLAAAHQRHEEEKEQSP